MLDNSRTRYSSGIHNIYFFLCLDTESSSAQVQRNKNQEVIHISCEWDAKNLESIRESLSSSLPEVLSTLQIFPMVEVEAEDYR